MTKGRGRRLTFGCVLAVAVVLLASGLAMAGEGYFDYSGYDFGGQKVSIVNWTGIPAQFREGGAAEGRLELAEELFNIGEIEYIVVPQAELAEFCLSRYMAGDSQYDIWTMLFTRSYWPLVTKGVLLSIDDLGLQGYYETASLIMQQNAVATTFKGKRYLVSPGTGSSGEEAKTNRDFIYLYYNKTMLEEAGCEDPYDLFKRGDWNWDNFNEMLRRVTKDTNGDGQIDQWGINACIYNDMASYWVHANGGSDAVFDENGRVVFAMKDDASRRALEQLYLWNSVEKVMHTTGTTTRHFADGVVCFYTASGWAYTDASLKESKFEWGVVPLPKGPDAEEIVVLGAVGGAVLPANAKDPEALLALYEFLYRGDNETIKANAEANDSVWRTREDYDVAAWQMENYKGVCPVFLTGAPDITKQYREMRLQIARGMSFSQAVNQFEPVIQGLLDDLYAQ